MLANALHIFEEVSSTLKASLSFSQSTFYVFLVVLFQNKTHSYQQEAHVEFFS